jgi:hypothetical protein
MFSTEYIYLFRTILRINHEYFLEQHWLTARDLIFTLYLDNLHASKSEQSSFTCKGIVARIDTIVNEKSEQTWKESSTGLYWCTVHYS